MTAISKAWVTIGDSAVDPDSPIDATLMTGIRDDLVHLREWLGAGFTAGAVQDHDHDGVNSKSVLIGPNYVRNPGFETDLGGWAQTVYTGGSIARQTGAGNFSQGVASCGIASTVLANGGGDILLSEYKPVNAGDAYPVHVDVKGSVANVSSKAEMIWYDSAQAQISASTIYTSTNTETGFTQKSAWVTAPSTARYAKVKLTGGIPGSGSATGTIYFDNVYLGEGNFGKLTTGTVQFSPKTGGSTTSDSMVKVCEFICPFSGTVSTVFTMAIGTSGDAAGRVYVNGVAAGTNRTANGTYTEDIAVVAGDLVQVYAKNAPPNEDTTTISNFYLQSSVPRFAAVT